MEAAKPQEVKEVASQDSSGSPEAKGKKTKKEKKKEKKEKGKKKEMISGKYPVTASQKEARTLFEGTGLDPKEKVRKRILKKAKKFLSKKGRAGSSSSSSSSEDAASSQEELQPEGLFCGELPIKGRGRTVPGSLGVRGAEDDAVYATDRAGGRWRSGLRETYSSPLLPSTSSTAGSWGNVARDAELGDGSRLGSSGAARLRRQMLWLNG